ncbi:MAG: hypothetical protein HC884_09800 [Chloroflexaceae bacterium]|nr:hypothetical protein [Chloroflexaceae bacterium]
MSESDAIRAAMQQQALRLREEFENLEEIRSWVNPAYNQAMQRAEIQFNSPLGVGRFWWGNNQWTIRLPDETDIHAFRGKLRSVLQQVWQDLRERKISQDMQEQALRLRDEYGDLEAVLGWSRPVYNHEAQQPEVRFDSPGGICRFWWEPNRWAIRLPDGGMSYAEPGNLRESLRLVRQLLRKGGL